MFDKSSESSSDSGPRPGAVREARPEDERIALRCNRRELQLLDTFVASGEFRSRSELMREALREFLRARALAGAVLPAETETVEVSVRLRRDEFEDITAYGELVAEGAAVPALLAQLLRRGALELKVTEQVAQARQSVRRSVEERAQLKGLENAGAQLTRQGIVGR
ncbi:MAG TPA: ribbon-helix-helix domain-containing protein [Thermoplasmata archaeon]|nr:ribbon-helix-helix domain-containing protein [Thermoplasmata archaeon]